MPRGPVPGWRTRKEPVSDDYLLAVITQAGGPGRHDPTTGLYGTLVIRGLKSRDEAKEWDLSLYRCALWLTRNRNADISVTTKIEHDGDGYALRFSVYNKTHGRAHVLSKHGADRSKWPYDPRRRTNPEPAPKPDNRPGWPPQGRVPLDVLREIGDT